MLDKLRSRARALKQETSALYFALQDARTPWYAKALAALVVIYAFSPIDLIPDFIPGLGLLDDLILVPAGIRLTVRLIPREAMEEARLTASAKKVERSVAWIGAGVIILVWVGLAALCVRLILSFRK